MTLFSRPKNLTRVIKRAVDIPAIIVDLIDFFLKINLSRSRGFRSVCEKNSSIELLFFVPYDEFYFFKFDLAIARFKSINGAASAVLTTNESVFLKFYCWVAGVPVYVIPKSSEAAIREAKDVVNRLFSECEGDLNYCKSKIVNFQINGIPYGKFIVADVLGRKRVSDYNLLLTSRFREEVTYRIGQAISAIDFLSDSFPLLRGLVFNEKNFLPANIIAFRLVQRFRVYEWKVTQKKGHIALKEFSERNFFSHPFDIALSKQEFCALLPQRSFDVEPSRLLRDKYDNNDWYLRDVLIPKGRDLDLTSVVSDSERPFKAVVGIFPHIFWDATFSYGENFFVDYKSLFEELFEIVEEFAEHLFLIKFHPDYSFKNPQNGLRVDSDYAAYVSQLARLGNCRVIQASESVNLCELLEKTDIVVTVRGTIGVEGAMLGKRVCVFGTGRYSEYGFVEVLKSVDCFRGVLRSFDKCSDSKFREERSRRALLFWKMLYEETPIDLSQFLVLRPMNIFRGSALQANYAFLGDIDIGTRSGRRLWELLQ